MVDLVGKICPVFLGDNFQDMKQDKDEGIEEFAEIS